jgi:hypothetical protein
MTILNIKNIICLEIGSYRDADLKYLAEYLNVSYEGLYKLKYEGLSYRIYVDIKDILNTKLVAMMFKGSRGEVSMCEGFVGISKKQMNALEKMNPILIKRPKFEKSNIEKEDSKEKNNTVLSKSVVFEMNAILDKISLHGIYSLTKEEKDYLDSLK